MTMHPPLRLAGEYRLPCCLYDNDDDDDDDDGGDVVTSSFDESQLGVVTSKPGHLNINP